LASGSAPGAHAHSGRVDEAVTDAGFGDQPGTGRVVAELLAELTRVDPQTLGLPAVLRSPDLLEDRPVGEHPSRVTGEEGEEGELLRRERDPLARHLDAVLGEV